MMFMLMSISIPTGSNVCSAKRKTKQKKKFHKNPSQKSQKVYEPEVQKMQVYLTTGVS